MKTIKKIKVCQMLSPRTDRPVPNQFIILTPEGNYFQSYETIIAFIPKKGNVILDRDKWNYSVTTSKYRNQFLGERKKETEQKIKDGIYKLSNLN